MAYKDLREFLDKLKETGDLVEINQEVDWNLEAGAIMRRCNETQGPAQLFNNVKDAPKGFRLMGEPLATFRRLAIAMDMPPDTPYPALLDEYMKRRKQPIKSILLNTGPCKENILVGDEVNLFKFPAPLLHEGDGGRYIGTWNVGASKDPDSDWLNFRLSPFTVFTDS